MTVYYCPVIGCDWSRKQEPLELDPRVVSAVVLTAQATLTEIALANHVIKKHTLDDFLSTARSYQTFMRSLSGILRDVPDTYPTDAGHILVANSMRARRRLADEIERTIHAWQKESNAR